MEYFEIYLFTQDREDARIALLASTLCNLQRTKTTDRIWTVKDFMPNFLNDSVSIPAKTEEEKLADERAYVQMLVSSGFAVMENK